MNVVFENNTTNAMGVFPKGGTNFALGAHTSFRIICTKLGNGTPALISSDTFSNSIWANPRGIAVNKDPKSGRLFGRLYAGSGGTGGFAFGNAGFKAHGVYGDATRIRATLPAWAWARGPILHSADFHALAGTNGPWRDARGP